MLQSTDHTLREYPTLSLIVLRVSDIDRSADVYSALGLTFQYEQHGSAPQHFSALLGDTVFELYPASEHHPVTTSSRIGFTVPSIENAIDKWRKSGCDVLSEPKNSPYGLRAIVADPDGHRVELFQKPE